MLLGSAMLAAPTGARAAAPDDTMIARWKASVLPFSNFTKHTDGEDIAWQVSPYLRGLVRMVEATGDRESLDAYCRAFEHLMSITKRDIDGLFGWPTEKGNYGAEGPRCIIMDDALICESVGLLGRALKQHPALERSHGARYRKYMAFVEEQIFPKWRESWLELREKTVTARHTQPAGTERRRVEVPLPEPAGVYRFYLKGKRPVRSLPLNQFWHVAKAYLAFYDATGKPEYLDKVTKMARAGKSIYLEPVGDRVKPWHYWQPVYPGDFKSEHEPSGWSGPHPDRSSYAAFEVGMMAEFHKRQIVFTDADIRRVVRLQLDYQWNKDPANPKFEYRYAHRPDYDKPYPSTLWSSLAYFDPTIRKMAEQGQSREAVEAAAGQWRGIEGVPAFLLRQKKDRS
jgi:hypothetical protein